MQRQWLVCQPNSEIFPDELMVEIISWLPVKHIMQLRCLNKFFKTLILDPHFVRMHLNKSKRNSYLALTQLKSKEEEDENNYYSLLTLSVPCLLQNLNQNQFTIYYTDPYYQLDDEFIQRSVIGSCNGLLCLISVSVRSDLDCLCFWNPAMRTKSKEFTMYFDNYDRFVYKFCFGYDNSTQTYKVIAFYVNVNIPKSDCNPKSVVKVFSLGDNSWRDLPCFPLIPLDRCHNNNGVHLDGTINWLALRDYTSSVDQYVILSLDLSSETYAQLLLPLGLDNVHKDDQPKIVILMDHLCFCYDFEETHFVIWKMMDFGVQDSWIQLFKISHESCFRKVEFLPFYLSENGDTLLMANERDKWTSIYNCIDNKVEKIDITNNIGWSYTVDYVESLVRTH